MKTESQKRRRRAGLAPSAGIPGWKSAPQRRAGWPCQRLTPLTALSLGCLLLACACDDGTIVDDWGPSAGHAAVVGHVYTAAGLAVAAGMEVALTRCGDPIGGFAGNTTTDSQGAYSVRGDLPPVGVLPSLPDSLSVQCELRAGRGFAESGPVDLYFFIRKPPTALQLDLVEEQAP